jgi:hypothetical protein
MRRSIRPTRATPTAESHSVGLTEASWRRFDWSPVEGQKKGAIWAYDPHGEWWQDRFLQTGGGFNSGNSFGDWFWTGGASANPNTVL